MTTLWVDLETFSKVPIRNGTHAYAEGAEIMLFAYAIDDGPVHVWDRTADKNMPDELYFNLFDDSVTIVAHNAAFDRTMMEHNKIHTDLKRWRCTMAKAYAHSLPGALGTLCDVFNISQEKKKDKEGGKLIKLFCIPHKTGIERPDRHTHPLEWKNFIEYARLDIAAMRELDKKIPNWNYTGDELDLWHLDQTINNRGFTVDRELAVAARRAVDRAQAKLGERTEYLSLGNLSSTTQRDQTLQHIAEAYGVELPDLTAATVERRMEDPELPVELKELLGIRLQASSTSTAKYRKLLEGVSADGRLRGTLQFCAAARTGRWGGRVFQPQNLMRPTLKYDDILFGIEAMLADCEDFFFENVMELCSNAIRGCIVATKGKKLYVSDLASIEGRVLPWLAEEQTELDAYAAYDMFKLDAKGERISDGKGGFQRVGPDLYCVAYGHAFHIDPFKVTKAQRQIGKVMVLMLGYAGGVGAFLTGAASYKIDLEDMAEQAWPTIPAHIITEARKWWLRSEEQGRTFGLSQKVFIVCDSLKRMWRLAHPRTVEFWSNLQNAMINAIENKGVSYPVGNMLRIRRDGNWTRIFLPSGRSLCYVAARVHYDKEGNASISYLGQCQYSRKFRRLRTYGGKLAENITQAVSRDIMAANMPRVEAAGYEILLTVHDEIISEAPDNGKFSAKHLSKLLATNPLWAPGLPLAAGGFEAYRYRKDD